MGAHSFSDFRFPSCRSLHDTINAPYRAQVSRRLCSFSKLYATACCIKLRGVFSLVGVQHLHNVLSASFILIIILMSLKQKIGPQYDYIVQFNILCFLQLKFAWDGKYRCRLHTKNLVQCWGFLILSDIRSLKTKGIILISWGVQGI